MTFFNEENVEYLLIGGYAVGIHGHPRATGDIDLWIDRREENASKVIRALERFGFLQEKTSTSLFLEPGNVIRMGIPPMRIELLNQIDGVEFHSCFERKEMTELDGILIPTISKSDLIVNKKAAGRPKDRADVVALESESKS